MKRLFNLIVCLGLVGSMAYAQSPNPVPTASDQNAPVVNTFNPNSDAYQDPSIQRGTVVLHNDQLVADLNVAYTLYPQPANKYLTIDLETDRATTPSVFLTTTDGDRLELTAKAPVTAMGHRMTLNLKNVPEGIYYLHIVVPGVGTSEGMPIIKMNSNPILIQ